MKAPQLGNSDQDAQCTPAFPSAFTALAIRLGLTDASLVGLLPGRGTAVMVTYELVRSLLILLTPEIEMYKYNRSCAKIVLLSQAPADSHQGRAPRTDFGVCTAEI